jgi:hypothetical protein
MQCDGVEILYGQQMGLRSISLDQTRYDLAGHHSICVFYIQSFRSETRLPFRFCMRSTVSVAQQVSSINVSEIYSGGYNDDFSNKPEITRLEKLRTGIRILRFFYTIPKQFSKYGPVSEREGVTLRLAVYRQSVRLGDNPLRLTTRNLIFQLNTCGYSPYVTSSLKGWICRLQLLLALASEVILRSESRGAHYHNLLS